MTRSSYRSSTGPSRRGVSQGPGQRYGFSFLSVASGEMFS